MKYTIVEREADNFIKFYVATKDNGAVYEVPCILNNAGEVDMESTQNKMDSHIVESDKLMTYIGE